MFRMIGMAAAAAALSLHGVRSPLDVAAPEPAAPLDVAALMSSARGAPPMICALAAQSVGNFGWGGGVDAPSTPLGSAMSRRDGNGDRTLAPQDVTLLLESLASEDACVRELAVRLLGRQRDDASLVSALTTRLGAGSSSLREVAAFGLGMLHSTSAVDPLIAAVRDATPGVRANAAWALGRQGAGRALAALTGLFNDPSEVVRAAAVVATGHIDSVSAVAALVRVLQHDESAEVRRVAAWALGQLDAAEAADALASVLGSDANARVREMSAWALGQRAGRSSGSALATALRRDTDDGVRETAAWALAEIGDRSAVDALGTAVESDRSARVRGTAAWGLGQLHGSGAKAPAGLLKALRDDSDDVRLKAAWALGSIGDASALSAIEEALGRETGNPARRALIRALVNSGGRNEAALTKLLTSSDAQVREAAVRGLAGRNSFNPWPWPWPRPRPFP